jgi:putative endonuclease
MVFVNTKTIGNKGEQLAIGYLKNKNYKILSQNYFFRAQNGPKIAEIDIISQKGDCFIFVEVKTIKANRGFLAQDKINQTKLWKIAKAAEMWLVENKIPLNVKWQIDVIAIEILNDNRSRLVKKLLGPKTKISHFENVAVS